ncbi:hypothetical protein [Halomonas aquatica]|uniref:Uncharacterized protein n=1 Tax=Halomonas aquatica TaxID=3151123 RepID=A0ABV1NJ56_9GAMM
MPPLKEKLRKILFIVSASMISATSFSQTTDLQRFIDMEESIGLVNYVELAVIDSVEGGCWLNSEEIKQEVRLQLESNGVGVYTEEVIGTFPEITTLEILGIGRRLNNQLCAGSLVIDLSGIIGEKYKERTFVGLSSIYEALFFGYGSSLDSHFKNATNQAISEMLANRFKSKRNNQVSEILQEYGGELQDPPKTRKELLESLN